MICKFRWSFVRIVSFFKKKKEFSSNKLHNSNVYSYIVEPDEIRRLGKRFRKLDLDGSGSLSIDEFMNIPDLQQNPLVQRVIDIFDADANGEVDFRGTINHSFTILLVKISLIICCLSLLFRIHSRYISIQRERRSRSKA